MSYPTGLWSLSEQEETHWICYSSIQCFPYDVLIMCCYGDSELSILSCMRLIACGIAVSTYNEGATDFRDTPAYKESIQSRELLEEPESSNSDVFEGNPTEVAPSLE
uniref:Uncharacterized protein n=1 Tax=Ananas comosus var. bracteatus TaxID=296719 RepID=A0A6V7PQH8_ANACO|nr:unnamed protein product [Ananas comosus var. bracteatus]